MHESGEGRASASRVRVGLRAGVAAVAIDGTLLDTLDAFGLPTTQGRLLRLPPIAVHQATTLYPSAWTQEAFDMAVERAIAVTYAVLLKPAPPRPARVRSGHRARIIFGTSE